MKPHPFLLVPALSFLLLGTPPNDVDALPAHLLLSPSGEAQNDHFGESVGTAGDVNGDGYADVIAGAHLSGAGGRAYVYYGGPGADSIPDLVFTGEASNDHFGRSVGTAGDVNGDGYADMIVGAVGNDAYANLAGRAYVFYGGPTADSVPDLTLTGIAISGTFGRAVGTAGDVNGDGCADMIVGADGVGGVGRAYVFYGGSAPNTTADLTFTGESGYDRFGYSVGTAGDVNGDGYADMIVGTFDASGRAYVFLGGSGEDETADLIFTGQGGDTFGNSVGTAGDVNGDGYADVIVGASWGDAGGSNAGEAFVYYGGPGMDTVADLTFTGESEYDYFGHAVGEAGDVNGDGYSDVIVGAQPSTFETGYGAGKAYIYLGGPGADTVADLTFTGERDGDMLGVSVGTAGDVNGNGFADVIVGAHYAVAPENGRKGMAYVYSLSGQVGVGESTAIPTQRFLPPMPNPGLNSTHLAFELDHEATVTLEAFDAQGRLVDRLIRGERLPQGVTTRVWRPRRLGSGIYYLRARLGERVEVQKLMWLGSR